MLQSIILCPDQGLAKRLEAVLQATGEATVARILTRYPNAIDLVRALRAHAPDVVFLSFESPEKAHEAIKLLEAEANGVQVVAVHENCDANLLKETMRAGVREFLSDPFERQPLMETLANVKAMLARKPASHNTTNQIFSFLPSKAGVGTTTIAVNIAAALAQEPTTQALLADFDLNSGMLRFMLKLDNEFSVVDAVEHSLKMDENVWPQLFTSFGRLDVLHAGRIQPGLRIEPTQIRALVGFLRRNYQALCFDLSGNLERYSIELMQESRRVLLVCTPEVASLHQAREKLNFLRTLDLDTRVSVVLNRCHKKSPFSKEQVEEVLGLPVWKVLPNDYMGVNRALHEGKWVAPDSAMGKEFSSVAHALVERQAPVTNDKHKFLQFFAVPNRAIATK